MNSSTDYTSFLEYQTGLWLRRIIYPSLVILGTIGNIFSIIVLTRKKIWKSTTAVYLVTLAFSDIFVLHTGLLRRCLNIFLKFDIRGLHSAMCKIHQFLSYYSLDFSGWILIAVTFERVIMVWFPYSAKANCTRRIAVAVLISIAVVLALLNGHMLFGFGKAVLHSGNDTQIYNCWITDDSYEEFINTYFHWIDLAKYSIVPFVSLLIGNVLIITKLLQSRKNIQNSKNTSVSDKPSKKRVSSLTRMLFAINTVYLICSTPVSVYIKGMENWIDLNDPHHQAINYLCWSILTILMYANNAFNFILYCFSGKKFRKELNSLQCRCKPNPKKVYKERTGSKSPPSVDLHM